MVCCIGRMALNEEDCYIHSQIPHKSPTRWGVTHWLVEYITISLFSLIPPIKRYKLMLLNRDLTWRTCLNSFLKHVTVESKKLWIKFLDYPFFSRGYGYKKVKNIIFVLRYTKVPSLKFLVLQSTWPIHVSENIVIF